VSAAYAGVFFRVEGGGAGGFGEIQKNVPRLESVEYTPNGEGVESAVGIVLGQTNAWLYSGLYHSEYYNTHESLRFTLSEGEVEYGHTRLETCHLLAKLICN